MNLKYVFIILFCAVSVNVCEAAPEKIEYPLTEKVDKKYRVGLVLINASNKKSETPKRFPAGFDFYSPQKIGDAFFKNTNSVNDFIRTVSYEKVGLEGTVIGWIDVPVITRDGSKVPDKNEFIKLITPHFAPSNYDVLIFNILTEGSGHAAGWAGDTRSPGMVWIINGTFFNQDLKNDLFRTAIYPDDVMAHELIHAMGINGHANSLDCGTMILDQTCTINAYGNVFSIMGDRAFGNHLDTSMLQELGWLEQAQVIQTSSTGTHTIYPIETKDTKTKAIFLKKDFQITNQQGKRIHFKGLRIEFRKPIAYDSRINRLDGGQFLDKYYLGKKKINKNGVVVLLEYNDSEGTALLDMNPTTEFTNNGSKTPGNTGKFADSILSVGESRVIGNLGVEIAALRESNDGGMVVQIQTVSKSEDKSLLNMSLMQEYKSPDSEAFNQPVKKEGALENLSTSKISSYEGEGGCVHAIKINKTYTELYSAKAHMLLKPFLIQYEAKKYACKGKRTAIFYYYINHQNVPDLSGAGDTRNAADICNSKIPNVGVEILPDGTIKTL